MTEKSLGRLADELRKSDVAAAPESNSSSAALLQPQASGNHHWRKPDARNIPRQDLEFLVRLFRKHGLGGRSLPLAVHLLGQTGDLGSLIGTSTERLKQLGVSRSELSIITSVNEAISTVLQRRLSDRPVLGDTKAVLNYLHASMAYLPHETFRVLFLDTRNHLIHDESMFRGTVNQAPAFPREIILRAMEVGSTSLIVVHNHPSGDPEPSREDIAFTRRLIAACRTVDIAVHDHLIIGKTGHRSLHAMGHCQ